MGGRVPFSPEHRLRTRKQFERVFQQGRRRGRSLLILFHLPRDPDGLPPRLGLAVSRKVGRAVVRNRVRRRLREIFRLHQNRIHPPCDLVVVARPAAANADYHALERDFLSALAKLGALADGEA